MSDRGRDGGFSGDSLVRPFLGRRIRPFPSDAAAPDVQAVRPYFVASGRTAAKGREVALDAVLQLTDRGRVAVDELRFEHRELAMLCSSQATSVVEAAARLHLPVGVVRVLAADFARDGLVELREHTPGDFDLSVLMRLRDGVRAL